MFFMVKRDKLNKGLLKVYENKIVKSRYGSLLGLLLVPDSRWFRDSRFKYVVLKLSTWTPKGIISGVMARTRLTSSLPACHLWKVAGHRGSICFWDRVKHGVHMEHQGPPKWVISYHLDHLEHYSNPKKEKKIIIEKYEKSWHVAFTCVLCFFARWPVWSKADQRSDGQDPCRLLDGMG